MSKRRSFMYICVMLIGNILTSPEEDGVRRIQVQVAVSRRFKIDHTWRYDLQSPFWRLYVHSRSGASISHDGARLALKNDRIYLIPAWVRFQCISTRPLIQDYMHFYVTGFPPTLLRRFFHQPLLLPEDFGLEGLCGRWRNGFDTDSAFTRSNWAASLAYAAVAFATSALSEEGQRACSNSWKELSPIGPALECIDQRLSKPPSNPELARLCRFSTDRFIRQFRLIIGMTPAQYGLERRVALAAEWLTASSRTLDQIADGAGFTDRFHFSRVFKARLGMPPVAYRKLHRIATHER